MHTQGAIHHPALQLESLHEQGGIDGLGAYSYNTLHPQSSVQNGVVLGVGQGPGNAEPRYTAATATALAARACPPDAFQFGRQMEGSSQGTNTSPGSLSSGGQQFTTDFTFSSAAASAGGGVSDSVSPHESFQAHMQPSTQQQGYLSPGTYEHQSKRRREDNVNDLFTSRTDASGSGDEDGELSQHTYGLYGEQYDGYGAGTGQAGMMMQSPDLLSQVQPGLGTSGHGPGFGSNVDQSGGQSAQGQQVGPDGKPKPCVSNPFSNFCQSPSYFFVCHLTCVFVQRASGGLCTM